ncbi:MAG: MBOAT family protein [Dokdonella sp.]
MLFNSFHFIVFFIVVLALNQPLKRWPVAQKLMLLAASYYFYGQWEWRYLFLVWFSTIVDYLIGLRMPRTANPRRLVVISVLVNLGFLAIFKYANWLIDSVNGSAALLGGAWHVTPIDLLLPVGISFYTFQSLSYTIDVYRGELPPRRNLLDYALAVAFFPQIEAGPIVRAREFLAELDGEQRVDFGDVKRALVLIAFGYVKKLVFADNLATIADPVFDNPLAHGFWDSLLAVYAFAFQIYCDFSGYTDIAIGCALLLGIRFPQNFNYPYAAESIQDFWRRWHMTLSRWLRDYLYIPLGGNRKGRLRTYANLMITMLLGGLWHGASWNFLVWGLYHGFLLIAHRLWRRAIEARGWAASVDRPIWHPLAITITFVVVTLGWIPFRAPDFASTWATLQAVFAAPDLALVMTHPAIILVPLLTLAFCLIDRDRRWQDWLVERASFRAAVTAAILTCIVLQIFGEVDTQIPFVYFQF